MQHLLILLALLGPGEIGPAASSISSVRSSIQAKPQYRARLSVVPIDVAMQNVIAGRGTVSATLAGTTLTLTGEFADLKTAATVARLHASPNKGIRGPVIADLSVTMATSGTITGSIELTPQQVTDLKSGKLYVQLHSEKAPDGNLWGWLLPLESRR